MAIWGGQRRAGAAIRYLLFGAVSGLSLLAAILAFGWLNGNGFSFGFEELASANLTPTASGWILARCCCRPSA